MKKKLVVSTILAGSLLASSVFAGNPITIKVNDNVVNSDVEPQIVENRTMVPLRFVSESLGAEVSWDQATNTVAITKQTTVNEVVSNYFTSLPENLNLITVEDAYTKMQSKEDVFYLDVRPPAEYNAGHLPGAVNIPFKMLGKKMQDLPKDKLIIVNCNTGQMSGQATAGLLIAGYDALSLRSGFNAWKEAGYDFETESK